MAAKPKPTHSEIEQTFPSTTWEWKHVMIGRRPAGPRHSATKSLRRWFGLPSRSTRERLPLTLALRGGSVCWIEVQARGRTAMFTGDTALYDVLREVCQDL